MRRQRRSRRVARARKIAQTPFEESSDDEPVNVDQDVFDELSLSQTKQKRKHTQEISLSLNDVVDRKVTKPSVEEINGSNDDSIVQELSSDDENDGSEWWKCTPGKNNLR